MKKKIYEKPTMTVVELQHKCQLLAGSGDPTRNVPGGTARAIESPTATTGWDKMADV